MSENPPITDEEEELIERGEGRSPKPKKVRKGLKHQFWLRRVGVRRYNLPSQNLVRGVYEK